MADQTTRSSPDVTVPLLTRIMEESLDQDYRQTAERVAKPIAKNPPPGWSAWLVLAAFGLLVGTAAVQSAQSAGDTEVERSSLVAQINSRRDRVGDQQRSLTAVRAETLGLTSDLDSLLREAVAVTATINRLEPPTGFAPVRGPGILMVIDDAPNADDSGLVRADDLALLINGLWTAGAEAISIDDQRLTTLTSLRNSGLTIGVNQVSLQAPYTVRAIGNPRTLPADLLNSTSGLAWDALVDELGFRVVEQDENDMSLPAERLRPLTAATIMQDTATNDPGREERP